MNQSFFVTGGDARQRAICRLLAERGAAVSSFALRGEDCLDAATAARLCAADVVLLPLPAADSAGFLQAPALEEKMPLETLWPLLHRRQKIFGGMFSAETLRSAASFDLHPVDYFAREEFALRNAYITAECALQLTMEHLDRTVRGTRCLILGYGRIGTFLARLLLKLGADVSVACRTGEDTARAQLDGCHALLFSRLAERIRTFDVIYNTVPAMILDQALLERAARRCLCIDLASKPGGMDFAAAAHLELQTLWALGLPGKLAPESAGAAILDTVFQLLAEQEVDI